MSFLLAGCLLSTVGCSGIDINSIPSESFATEAEIVNYNTEQLNYKASIEQQGVELEYGYSLNAVDDTLAKQLEEKAKLIELELGSTVYNSVTMHVSEDLFNTFKGLIDDKYLTSDTVVQVGSSKGYYFVDKRYKITPLKAPGSPKMDTVQYLGINGAFKEDANGNVDMDTSYVSSFDSALQDSDRKADIIIDDTTDLTSTQEKGTLSLTNSDLTPKALDLGNVRRPVYNSVLANEVIGTSVESLAIMPELTRVYVPVNQSGSLISGNGISIQGDKTLKHFDYDINKQTGSVYVRYVFKQHLTDPDKVEFINAYMMNFEYTHIPSIDEDIVVPDFVVSEATKLLNRADRVVANVDLSGLMSGDIFADIGPAILTGYLDKYAYAGDCVTSLLGVVGRNIDQNSYLLRISTTREIGAKGGVDSGKYKFTGYAVMTMLGTEFVITDYVYTQMQTIREPSVNLDDTIIKQLASLNLAGDIDAETQSNIEAMLSVMYSTVSGDGVNEMRYLTTSGENVGYADSFSDDTSLLQSKDKDYAVSRMEGWITKYGNKVGTNYAGFVSSWLGGTDTQAEFITQELFEYPDKDAGIYLNVYYLVSNYDDDFKVVEMRPLASKQVTGTEMAEIKKRIENKEEFIVDNPDNVDISLITSSGTKNIAAQKIQDSTEESTE